MPGFGIVRAPRCWVNGVVPIECTINISKHQGANTFFAELAMDDPANGGISAWDQEQINVTITGTNDVNSGGQTTIFQGGVDHVIADFYKRTFSVSGRDLTSGPLDKKTNEKWLNKSPQDIITDLAGRSGLGVQFNATGSAGKAGLKFNQDYNRISELDSHWNVIVRLARDLGCIAYVNGQTLFVEPLNSMSGGTFQVTYQPPNAGQPASANVVRLRCSRDLQISSKGVKVQHTSWQQKEAQAIKSVFSVGAGGLLYTLKAANLTKEQQDQLAQAHANDIASHEKKVSVTTYGDVSITPSMGLSLSGTGTQFDQTYIIMSIRHDFGWNAGYQMTIEAQNSDSENGQATQSS